MAVVARLLECSFNVHQIAQDEDGDMFWQDASALLDGGGGGGSRSAGTGSNEPSLDLQRWYAVLDDTRWQCLSGCLHTHVHVSF